MRTSDNSKIKTYGFSLIEMAIVLFIIALLLGGLLPTISSQIAQKNRNETRKQLDEIQQALFGYAIINKRLPCPAKKNIPTIPGTANGAGTPDITGSTCNTNPGVLPWVELGLSETDAWGRRFTYAVTSTAFTSPIVNISLTSTGTLTIKDGAAGNNIASTIPAVVISHGVNGLGAYTPQGTQIPNTSASNDEKANAAGPTTFVNHDTAADFDDLVVWISPTTLFNRMVTAGVLSN